MSKRLNLETSFGHNCVDHKNWTMVNLVYGAILTKRLKDDSLTSTISLSISAARKFLYVSTLKQCLCGYRWIFINLKIVYEIADRHIKTVAQRWMIERWLIIHLIITLLKKKCGDNEQCTKSKVQRKNTNFRSRTNTDLYKN